jgi:CheY-like chemotaxis protein
MKQRNEKPITILVAEDDPDDRLLMKDALGESGLAYDLYFAEDGEELMAYLRRQGRYAQDGAAPTPGLILLDLNMPKKDGREALWEIRMDPQLRRIPVVVLTTSCVHEDVVRSYGDGATSFVTKPVTFEALVGVLKTIVQSVLRDQRALPV